MESAGARLFCRRGLPRPLERFPAVDFEPIWVRPRAGFTGNHVFVTNGALAFDYHGYVSQGRLIDHFTRRARRLFPGWSADLVPVSVSLIDREDAKTIGMDIREPRQFLHDALPRARRYLDRFDHRVIDQPQTPPALEAGRRGYST